MITSVVKKCSSCKQELDYSYFGSDKSTPTGLKSRCKQCEKAYMSNYYKNNSEIIKTRSKERYVRTYIPSPRPPKLSYEERRERDRQKASKFYYSRLDENRSKNRSRMSIRNRIIKESSENDPFSDYAWLIVSLYYGEMCMFPFCYSVENLHLDHIQPLSKGGGHTINNLQILCRFHNIQKGARNSNDYRPVVISNNDIKEIIDFIKGGGLRCSV